jgi:hypothetical protein
VLQGVREINCDEVGLFSSPLEGAIHRNVNIIAQEKKKSKNFFEIMIDFLKNPKRRGEKAKKRVR